MTTKTCAHASCSCSVDPAVEHCSPYCESRAGEPVDHADGCACGHSECLGVAGAERPEGLERGADMEPDEKGPTADD